MDIRRRFSIFSLIIGLLLTVYPPYGFTGSQVSSYEEGLFIQINQYRITHGLSPLAMDKNLTRLAKRHSMHMEKKMC